MFVQQQRHIEIRHKTGEKSLRKQGGQTPFSHMLDTPFPLFGRTLEVFRLAP